MAAMAAMAATAALLAQQVQKAMQAMLARAAVEPMCPFLEKIVVHTNLQMDKVARLVQKGCQEMLVLRRDSFIEPRIIRTVHIFKDRLSVLPVLQLRKIRIPRPNRRKAV